jgi:3-phosphoshikimate 1-carboxyvinyltransferase
MKINSIESFNGIFEVAGDKSITHRAVMFSAMAEGTSIIKKPLLGEDCLSTIDCMRILGSHIEIENDIITVKGIHKFNDNVSLYCGNSGTTIRLLTGLLSGKNITAVLSGDESLSKRPMKRVSEPIKLLGAAIETNDGFAPINIRP